MNQKAEVTRHSSFTLTTQCALREHTLDYLKHLFNRSNLTHGKKQIYCKPTQRENLLNDIIMFQFLVFIFNFACLLF